MGSYGAGAVRGQRRRRFYHRRRRRGRRSECGAKTGGGSASAGGGTAWVRAKTGGGPDSAGGGEDPASLVDRSSAMAALAAISSAGGCFEDCVSHRGGCRQILLAFYLTSNRCVVLTTLLWAFSVPRSVRGHPRVRCSWAAAIITGCTVRVEGLGWAVVGPYTCGPTYTIFGHLLYIEVLVEGDGKNADDGPTTARSPKPSLAEVLPPQGCG